MEETKTTNFFNYEDLKNKKNFYENELNHLKKEKEKIDSAISNVLRVYNELSWEEIIYLSKNREIKD